MGASQPSIVICSLGDLDSERKKELQCFQLSDACLEPVRRLDEQRVGAEGRRWHRAKLALQQRAQRRGATAAVDLLPKEERDCQHAPEGRLVDCLIGRMTNQI